MKEAKKRAFHRQKRANEENMSDTLKRARRNLAEAEEEEDDDEIERRCSAEVSSLQQISLADVSNYFIAVILGDVLYYLVYETITCQFNFFVLLNIKIITPRNL